MSNFIRLLPKVPMIFSSTIDYYRYGPPQPSWDLKFYLTLRLLKDMLKSAANITIEDAQKITTSNSAIDNGILVDELSLSNSLRKKSEVYIDEILKDYNHVLLDDWKSVNLGNGLECEWIYVKEEVRGEENNNKKKKYDKVILFLHGGGYLYGSAGSHRSTTSKIAKSTNARLFAINYRLAPQNQFPAALHDSITAYNYLIDPPKDADFLPIEPKNIVIMGNSAGGGLTLATLLAIRDSKGSLPLPAGAVVWSLWADLAKTTSSIIDPGCDETDYMTNEPFHNRISPVWEEFERKANELSEKIQLNVDNKPRFWHKSFDRDGRLHHYVSNEGLAIPYVSPLLAESLGGLPPILVQVGDVEKLRDESIYLAYKASNPEKYNLPYYNAKKFEKSPYKTPTKVVLEVYEEMPHVFQIAFKRTAEFIEQLSSGEEGRKEIKVLRVTGKGEIIEELKEEHYKTLEWKDVGIVPSNARNIYCVKLNN
ncbi:6400_t:CDS:2 [Entrophospora sp. SA101]|nr:654_t:CDS:2 [Entrophospora sp. SA101]CAJ0631149.1 4131_t:CDS:2 [Entrophospora sp. SA101]CAJ0759332.1 6400_t:CDS:2 [Entrophospora sp. SA101]CAJ0879222.1 19325_t:CDS:2 [Entrophospora sp. SA101]CAJ0906791.1 8997_t:CDS:2 [Entrophospora sp. SA101]